MKITIDQVLSWKPCEGYETKEELLKITKERKSLTPLEISKLRIPCEDRIWVLLRPQILGKENYKEIGIKIANRAVKKHCLKCGIKDVEEWAKKWLAGDHNVDAAIYAAARYTYIPAYVAVDAACADAAAAAARIKERKWQLNLIKKYLEK